MQAPVLRQAFEELGHSVYAHAVALESEDLQDVVGGKRLSESVDAEIANVVQRQVQVL